MEEIEVALLGFLPSSEASLQSPCSRSLDLWESLSHYWKSMSSLEQKGRKADWVHDCPHSQTAGSNYDSTLPFLLLSAPEVYCFSFAPLINSQVGSFSVRDLQNSHQQSLAAHF